MAKYYFWINLDKKAEYVEIPDELLDDLDEEQKENILLREHDKWCRNRYYGDWKLIKEE